MSASSETIWYLSRDGQQLGPISDARLRDLHRSHRIAATDYVWSPSLGDWALARDVLPPPPARPTANSVANAVAAPPVVEPPRPTQLKPPPAQRHVVPRSRAQQAPPPATRSLPKPRRAQPSKPSGSFKMATGLYVLLGALVPLWPISLPLFWYLAYRSYRRPAGTGEAMPQAY